MLEAVAIVLQVLFLLFLALLAPLGMWWLSDPSREAPGWIDSAREALDRGEPEHALGLVARAASWPRRGRYSERQRQTTAQALEVAAQALERMGRTVPEPLVRAKTRLEAGERELGPLAGQARGELEALTSTGPPVPA